MANDSFTEVTSASWFGRIGRSFKGILFGLVLIAVSFPVLWLNEGRAVHRASALKEGASAVVSIDATETSPEFEGALVHLSGLATTEETLQDPVFGLGTQALKLLRDVEMYQWDERTSQETKKKLGGGEETTTKYSYVKAWSSDLLRSSRFKHPSGHENPDRFPYDEWEGRASDVELGAYRLTPSQIGRIDAYEPVPVTQELLAGLPADLRERVQIHAQGLYIGAKPNAPDIGDLRITFSKVPPVDVSIVSRRIGSTFEPFQAKKGSVDLLQIGLHSADAMFTQAKQQNRVLTWILRAVGLILMVLGFRLVMEPLAVVADVIPFLGDVLRLGTGAFSFIIGLTLSLVTVAAAWVAYRPVLGISLLALAFAGLFMGVRAGRRKKELAVGTAPDAPPEPPPPPPSPESA